MQHPEVKAFLHAPSGTFSYVVWDPATLSAAVFDSVLDYDDASGRTAHHSSDEIVSFVRDHGLCTSFIIDTHVHADHLSAMQRIQRQLGGKLCASEHIGTVQSHFGRLFNTDGHFACDGSQFNHLFTDGETYRLGTIEAKVIHTPGHTPACMTHVIGDAAFVGDTLLMPDSGTARCDFPGGDAATLYRSIQKILALPHTTRLFLCHDYKSLGRDEFVCETTIAAQRRDNIHIHDGISEAEFVAMRSRRDATLPMPKLILPSVQVNMRAGQFPPVEGNGVHYLKIPLNAI